MSTRSNIHHVTLRGLIFPRFKDNASKRVIIGLFGIIGKVAKKFCGAANEGKKAQARTDLYGFP